MGRYQHTVDSKGRIFIPSKVREDLGKQIYITLSLDDPCLSGYTPEQLNYIREQLHQLPGTDPKVRALRRRILGEAILCDIDAQGRVTITDELWKSVNISGGDAVYIIYLFDKMEIWSKDEYDKERTLAAEGLSEDLSKYDIKGI